MPRPSVWFVRAALLYFLAGFALGALMLAEKGVPYSTAIFVALPIHMEFLLVGWLVQLAMGIAYWIMPRMGDGTSRGNESVIWVAFGLLNAGVLSAGAQLWIPFTLLAARLCELLAVLIFVIASWPRLRPHVGGPRRQILR